MMSVEGGKVMLVQLAFWRERRRNYDLVDSEIYLIMCAEIRRNYDLVKSVEVFVPLLENKCGRP